MSTETVVVIIDDPAVTSWTPPAELIEMISIEVIGGGRGTGSVGGGYAKRTSGLSIAAGIVYPVTIGVGGPPDRGGDGGWVGSGAGITIISNPYPGGSILNSGGLGADLYHPGGAAGGAGGGSGGGGGGAGGPNGPGGAGYSYTLSGPRGGGAADGGGSAPAGGAGGVAHDGTPGGAANGGAGSHGSGGGGSLVSTTVGGGKGGDGAPTWTGLRYPAMTPYSGGSGGGGGGGGDGDSGHGIFAGAGGKWGGAGGEGYWVFGTDGGHGAGGALILTYTIPATIIIPPPAPPVAATLPLRKRTYRHRLLGWAYKPSITITKDRPGALRIIEFSAWMS